MEADPNKEKDLADQVVAAAIVKSKKRKRQSSILNYVHVNNQPPGPKQYVDEDLITGPVSELIFSGDGVEYSATEQSGKIVAELTLFWDDRSHTYWVNNIEVNQAYRRKGVATGMLKLACEEHGTIYFSTQQVGEDTALDTRSMSLEAGALARRAVNHPDLKIIVTHPNNLPAG